MKNFAETWETYASAWAARDRADKLALLGRSVAQHAAYRDPAAECRGHDELVGYMLEFHKQVPGGHFETTYFLVHHGRSIAKWNMMSGAGEKVGEGVSYGEYGNDGMLVAMTGFFEVPPVP
jgi:SnoaL-like domain